MINVGQLVSSHPVIFFSREQCHYCNLLQADIESMGIPYKKVMVTDEDRDEFKNQIATILGVSAESKIPVPQLFIGGKIVGGYKEFTALIDAINFENSKLLQLLKPLGISISIDF